MNDTQLICNAHCPLISDSKLRDELILYNIPHDSYSRLFEELESLLSVKLLPESDIGTLSGGQKVMVMCLMALFSPATDILFIDLMHALDTTHKARIGELLSKYGKDKQITYEEEYHAN